MDDQKLEGRLERLFKQNSSAGTEAFRDELLARCLIVLNSESANGGSLDAAVLDDSVLIGSNPTSFWLKFIAK